MAQLLPGEYVIAADFFFPLPPSVVDLETFIAAVSAGPPPMGAPIGNQGDRVQVTKILHDGPAKYTTPRGEQDYSQLVLGLISKQDKEIPAMLFCVKPDFKKAFVTAVSAAATKPTYALQYFDARGVVEVVRFLFAVAKQDYEDRRFGFTFGTPGDFSTIQRPEFDKAKAAGDLDLACGKVPVLLVDNVPVMGQSKAIERYVARKLGMMGSNDEEAGRIDALCENVRDIKDAYQAAKRKPEGDERDAAIKTFFDEVLVKWCQDTEKSLPPAQDNFLVGTGISLADLTWYNLVGVADKPFFDNVDGARAAFAGCPRIVKAMEECAANAQLKAWIEKRPKTPF